MLPDSLDWIGFWCMGRLEHQDDVAWNLQPLGSVGTRLIQLDNENAVLVLCTHQIQKHLETSAVEVCELIEEMVSRCGFHDPVQIGSLKLPLHFAFGLDAFGRDFAPTDGLESEARLILAEKAYLPAQSQYRYGNLRQHR